MPTPDTLKALKKSCQLAAKKDLRFYFFAKATDGEPELVIGKPSAARQQQQQLAKAHRTKPAAQGVLTHGDQGLTFELYKGKPAPLKRALKGPFGGVPALKAAGVAMHKKKATAQSRLQAAVKGGPKAFQRRADKVAAALKTLDTLHHRLLDAGVTDSEGASALRALRRELEAARVLAETDPKDAYAELASARERLAELIADREEQLAAQDARGATRTLDGARRAIDALAAGIDQMVQTKTPASALKQALAGLQGQLADAESETNPKKAEALSSALRGSTRALREQIAKHAGEHQRVMVRASEAAAQLARCGPLLKTLARKKIDTGDAGKQLKQHFAALARAEVSEPFAKTLAAIAQIQQQGAQLHRSLLQKAQAAPPDKKLSRRISKTAKHIDALDALCEANASAWDTSAQQKAADALRARLEAAEALAATDLRAAYAEVTAARNETLRASAVIKEQAKNPDATRLQLRTAALQDRKLDISKRVPEAFTTLRTRKRFDALEGTLVTANLTPASLEEADTISGQLDRLEALAQAVREEIPLAQAATAQAEKIGAAIAPLRGVLQGLVLLKVDGHTQHEAEIGALATALDAAKEKAQVEPAGVDKELARLSEACVSLDRAMQRQLDGAVSGASEDDRPRLEALLALHRLRTSLDRAAQIHAALQRAGQQSSDVAETLADIQERAAPLDSEVDYDPVAALPMVEAVDADAVKLRTALELKDDALARLEQKREALLQGSIDAVFQSTFFYKELRAYARTEYSTENVTFYAALRDGLLQSPRAKEEAYHQFIREGSPAQLNLPKTALLPLFPEPPGEQHRGDALFWGKVDYTPLKESVLVNLADTYGRLKTSIDDRIAADLQGTSLRNAQKVIKRWSDRMR